MDSGNGRLKTRVGRRHEKRDGGTVQIDDNKEVGDS